MTQIKKKKKFLKWGTIRCQIILNLNPSLPKMTSVTLCESCIISKTCPRKGRHLNPSNPNSVTLEMLEIGMWNCGLKGHLIHSINYIFVYFNHYHSWNKTKLNEFIGWFSCLRIKKNIALYRLSLPNTIYFTKRCQRYLIFLSLQTFLLLLLWGCWTY